MIQSKIKWCTVQNKWWSDFLDFLTEKCEFLYHRLLWRDVEQLSSISVQNKFFICSYIINRQIDSFIFRSKPKKKMQRDIQINVNRIQNEVRLLETSHVITLWCHHVSLPDVCGDVNRRYVVTTNDDVKIIWRHKIQ